MNRTRFEERVKLITDDANSLHERTEDALGELIKSISGGLTDILFDNSPPTFTHIPATSVTIHVLNQRFAVLGVPGEVATTNFVRPDTPETYRIFFIVGRTDVTGSRDRLVITGSSLSVISDTVVVEDTAAGRIDVTTGGATPTLGPNDVGYVELGSVYWTGSAWAATHNTAAVYAFPGIGPSYANHGAKHVDPLQDPIQVADMTGRIGLMPLGSFPILKGSVQDVSVSPSSPYLTAVTSGNNDPGNLKRVVLRVRHSGAFTIEDISGDKYLALDFPTGPYKGDSGKPAHSNHTHPPSESPIAVLSTKITVGVANLDSLLAEIEFAGIARIYQTQVFWAKPGTVSPEHPLAPCGWFEDSGGTVGATAIVTGNKKIRVQTGSYGFVHLNNAALSGIFAPVTWTYATDPNYPTSGELFVRVTGIR